MAAALAEWLEHAAGVAAEADAAAHAGPEADAGRQGRKRARHGADHEDANPDRDDDAAGGGPRARGLVRELTTVGQALLAALRAQRPLASPAERDAAWRAEGAGPALDARAAKTAAKAQRRWHVLLGEMAVRVTVGKAADGPQPGTAALRKLVARLAAESLAQCSVRDVDENFAVYLDAVHRLVTRAPAHEAADFAPALVELVRARGRRASTTAALNTDSQSQISQMVLALARGLRAVAEAAAARSSWASAGDLAPALETLLLATNEILCLAPSLCRTAASQVDQACRIVVSGALGPRAQNMAAQVMARLPVAYGANTSIAWDAVTHACLQGMVDLLRSLYKLKARGALAKPGGVALRASKMADGNDSGSGGGGGGKVSDFFPGLQAVARDGQDVKVGTFAHARAVGPVAAYEGLCATLGHALRVAQGGLFMEISLNPLVDVFELGLACSTCAKHPSFSRTAAATLGCLRDLAAVAGMKLLRFRSTLTGLAERLLALPPSQCPLDLEVATLETCRALAVSLSASIGRHVTEACLRRAADLVAFVSEGGARDQDEKVAQVVASQTKGKPAKKRRVAARQVSRAPDGPNAHLAELPAANAALATAAVLLAVAGADLPQSVRDLFDAAILDALQPVLTGSSLLLNESSACARDADFRLALLRALQASVLAPVMRTGTSAAAPTALVVFARCLRDPDPRVAELAILARASCLALVHPTAPVIGAPRRLKAYVDTNDDDGHHHAFGLPARDDDDDEEVEDSANGDDDDDDNDDDDDDDDDAQMVDQDGADKDEAEDLVAPSPEDDQEDPPVAAVSTTTTTLVTTEVTQVQEDEGPATTVVETVEKDSEETLAPRQTRAQRASARAAARAAPKVVEEDQDDLVSDSGSDLPSIVDDE